jgi:glycine cleavage system H lipoate-binding protein
MTGVVKEIDGTVAHVFCSNDTHIKMIPVGIANRARLQVGDIVDIEYKEFVGFKIKKVYP